MSLRLAPAAVAAWDGDTGWLQMELFQERMEVEAMLVRRHADLLERLQSRSSRLHSDDGFDDRDLGLSSTRASESVGNGHVHQDARNPQTPQKEKPVIAKRISLQDLLPSRAPFVRSHGSGVLILSSPPEGTYRELAATWLDAISGVVILLNIFCMAVQAQYNSYDLFHGLAREPGSRPGVEVWPLAAETFKVTEWVFGTFFMIELAVRILLRINLCQDLMWNTLDAVIIAAWIVERLSKGGGSTKFNPTVLRLVRLVRLMRLLKLLRHVRIFDPLYLIMKAIQSSMSVLVWTVPMLILMMMMVGMVNASLLKEFIDDATQDADARFEIYQRWGSFWRSFVSMFEITLANWPPQCWLLMNKVNEIWGIFFIFWKCCVGFAVVQVITSVFIQHTFKVASQDEDIMIKEKEKAGLAYLRHVEHLFMSLDQTGDGMLSREEFNAALEEPRLRYWFSALEIDASQLSIVFQVLDSGDGEVSKEEFIDGLKKVKGQAQSIDMLGLRKEVRMLRRALEGDRWQGTSMASSCFAGGADRGGNIEAKTGFHDEAN